MKAAVIGLGFGDEGKGLVTDWLANTGSYKTVIRFSGGHQAGHTVVLDDNTKHIFSSYGSGTLRRIPTYLLEIVIDPVSIINEYYSLQTKMSNIPKLLIDKSCPVTTIFDKIYNKMYNDRMGHGSVGVGVGTTIQREEDHYHLLAGDLLFPNIAKKKFKLIYNYYNAKMIKEFGYDISNIGININWKVFENQIKGLSKISKINDGIYEANVIFEGSQGLMLDQNIGFFPHVTRSNTGLSNIMKFTQHNTQIYLVTRAYQTRHGNGPMTTEFSDHIIDNPDETNVSNYQGEFRKSMLDVDLLKYALYSERLINDFINKILVVTCVDHLKEYLLSHQNNVVKLSTKEEFVKYIAKVLKIPVTYISESPVSSNIKPII
jgi:adenylosuccinate synthase